jgi:AAA15 family ATPase/GTPase
VIIELAVENFRSIKTRQTFSLTKSKSKSSSDELDGNAFDPKALSVSPLLRTAVIYGANAAGKSNFIKAVKVMREIVANSAKNIQRGDKLPITHFKLCDSTIGKPTEFEVVFIADGIKYQYGFSATSERIMEEWLYAFPKSRSQRWFIRAFDEAKDEYVWDFGSFFVCKKQTWKDSTRNNSLFLSTAVMLNSEQLKPIYDWFTKILKVVGIDGWNAAYTAELCAKDNGKKDVLKFLNSADLDINDLKLESKKFDTSTFPDDMPSDMKSHLLKELEGKEFIDIKTVHKTAQGKDILFELDDESDGTRKIFSFAGPWIDTLRNGKVLFIDELHDSLHPHIVKFLVNLFHNKKTNPNNAQLIFTTHETSILDQDVFRHDQIWFCKKDREQATKIYPLSDFSPRKGAENLEKSYLAGRYSALPVISTLGLLGE